MVTAVALDDFLALKAELFEKLDRFTHAYTLLDAAGALASGKFSPERNVVGLGVGEGNIAGTQTVRPVVRAYVVVRSEPLHRQMYEYLSTAIGARAPIAIRAVGRPSVHHHIRTNYAPHIPAGILLEDDGTHVHGTLGAWVLDGNDDPHMLSCWHALAGEEDPIQNSDVLHPAGGNAAAAVSSFIAPDFSVGAVNTVDAALARPVDGIFPEHFALRLGEIAGVHQPTALHTRVRKSGAYSHVTEGEITDFNATFLMDYPVSQRGALFDGWIIEPVGGPQAFSIPGDSGSIVLDLENRAVAMVLGGDFGAVGLTTFHTLAMPIDGIFSEFDKQQGIRLRFRLFP